MRGKTLPPASAHTPNILPKCQNELPVCHVDFPGTSVILSDQLRKEQAEIIGR